MLNFIFLNSIQYFGLIKALFIICTRNPSVMQKNHYLIILFRQISLLAVIYNSEVHKETIRANPKSVCTYHLQREKGNVIS